MNQVLAFSDEPDWTSNWSESILIPICELNCGCWGYSCEREGRVAGGGWLWEGANEIAILLEAVVVASGSSCVQCGEEQGAQCGVARG